MYGINSNEEVCSFVDRYIQCNIPSVDDDEDLHHLVLRCQVHKCLKSKCQKKKGTACKYNFPRLPSNKTVICDGHDTDEYTELPKEEKEKIKFFF